MDMNRMQEQLQRIAKYGQDEEGAISRLLFSREYFAAAETLATYMKEAGMETTIDAVGNVHGIYSPHEEANQTIILGSHLDTVANGGMFDGLLGIIVGVECVRKLKREKVDLHNKIEVIAFNAEEGNSLGGTFGSRSAMGLIDVEDEDFLKRAEEYRLKKTDLLDARMKTEDKKCYLELHIEQGNTLEEKNKQLGIINGIVGLERYRISIKGKSNHAGTTMMENRRDALVEASRLIVKMDELARAYGNNMVATTNCMKVFPNVLAVISEEVEFVLEIRNLDPKLWERFIKEVKGFLKDMTEFQTDIQKIVGKQPVECDAKIIRIMEEISKEDELSYEVMPSGATHDANAMAAKMPVGMIFVPSKGGISHSRDEFSSWCDIQKGAELLYRTIIEIDQAEL